MISHHFKCKPVQTIFSHCTFVTCVDSTIFLPAATKLWPRYYIYTCLSFCSQGGSPVGRPPTCQGEPPGTGHPPGPARHPPDQADTPQTRQTPPRTRQTPPGTRQTVGCVCSRGVSAPRGYQLPSGVVSQHALRQTPPMYRMTDRCKNITLATTSLRPVMKEIEPGRGAGL